jgi:mRNA interferase HigB
VRVIKRSTLLHFARGEPGALQPLRHWYLAVKAARWKSFADLRRTFVTADQVRTNNAKSVVVFDVGGNKYRLVSHVSYPKSKVYVLRIMTHREYDRGRWKDDL